MGYDSDFNRKLNAIDKAINGMLRLGTVKEIDYATAKVKVDIGKSTGWLSWLEVKAGLNVTWNPPEIGEQVIILSPEGKLENGVVLGGIAYAIRPLPSNSPDEQVVKYQDGAIISYNHKINTFNAQLPNGGTTNLNSTGGINFTGNFNVTGDCHVTGDETIEGNLKVGGNQEVEGNSSITGNLVVATTGVVGGVLAVGGLTATGGGSVKGTGGMEITGGDIKLTGGNIETNGEVISKEHSITSLEKRIKVLEAKV